jgi:nicotinate dehydrogenase subunit B
MIPNTLPQGLQDNPRLDQWIGFAEGGRVRIATGKVELGQGILTAIIQIAADELDVAPERIAIATGDTQCTPSEGFTAGSLSVQTSGASVRLVAAEVRALMLAAAADQLGCDVALLSVANGAILRQDRVTGLDYWQLASALDLSRAATGGVPVKAAAERQYIGRNLPRVDLPMKVFGGGVPFIHDKMSADMLHARVVRQPWPRAALEDDDFDTVVGADVRVVRLHNFLAVVADSERQATRAAENLSTRVRWMGGRPLRDEQGAPGWMATQAAVSSEATRGGASSTGAAHVSQRYTKPFIAHASIGPSCALARFDGNALTVWTHTQGVMPLRGALAKLLDREPASIHVRHVAGAGCYGHNGADDVAADAAVIAMHCPGQTVRVQWSREDELSAGPLGSAMVVNIEAHLSANGYPLVWMTQIWGGSHVQRPGVGGAINLLATAALEHTPADPAPLEMPEAAGGSGARNAWLLYDVPKQSVRNNIAIDTGPRTSAMRGLGAFANVFAIESFVDELALAAGIDPVAYRIAMTSDARARAVIERVAVMAGWVPGAARSEGTGRGVAYSRYKGRAGYCAIIADVRIENEVRLEKIWCAVDVGLAINPDGVINQIEGGIIQAASWTLKEQVQFAAPRLASRSWETYPILRFSEVPLVEIALIEGPEDAPLGAGEVSQGPAAGAIANAVADALGLRIRDLPLTRERIIAAVG